MNSLLPNIMLVYTMTLKDSYWRMKEADEESTVKEKDRKTKDEVVH